MPDLKRQSRPVRRLVGRPPHRSPWLRLARGTLLAVILGLTIPTMVPAGGDIMVAGVNITPVSQVIRSVASQVGQPAPDFTVTTLEGQPLTSADLLAQEKPYILYFFATW